VIRDDEPVHVRAFRRDEYELLRDLRVRMLEDSPDAFTITADAERNRPLAWWRDRLVSSCADPHRLPLVAEVGPGDVGGSRPVGSALGVIDPFERTLAHLYALWVEPAARRQGVASALIDTVFEWAREQGAKVVDLSVTVGNDGAVALYERWGFRDTGEREPLRPGSRLELMKMRSGLQ
jgi:ribosomal protein S18 acetylase RimI-like enzyme